MRLIETLKTPEPQNSKKLDRQTFGRSCREAPAQHIHVAPTYPSEGKHSSSLEKHFWYLVSCAQPSLWHILRAGCSCVCYLFTDCVAQSAGFLSPLASSSPRDFPRIGSKGWCGPQRIITESRRKTVTAPGGRLALPEQWFTACLARGSHCRGASESSQHQSPSAFALGVWGLSGFREDFVSGLGVQNPKPFKGLGNCGWGLRTFGILGISGLPGLHVRTKNDEGPSTLQ